MGSNTKIVLKYRIPISFRYNADVVLKESQRSSLNYITNHIRYKKLYMRFLVVCLLFVSSSLFAQKDKKRDVETIVAEANREIPESYRISEMPKIIDTVIKYRETNYSLLALMYNTPISVDSIQAAKVSLKDKLPQLYNTYVRLGIGYPLMPLADVYYNNGRSRNYFYGASVNHLSGFGKIKNYPTANFDRTKARIYGGIRKTNWSGDAELVGNFRGLYYYGVRNKEVAKDSIRQRFNEVGTHLSVASHKKDSANLNYKIDFSYLNFSDRKLKGDSLRNMWNARENYVDISPKFWYKWGKETFGADLGVKYNGYRYGMADSSVYINDSSVIDSGIVVNNTIVNLKLYATTFAFNNKLKATLGMDLVYDAGIINKFRVYPVAEIKYNLFNGVFIPYLNIGGGLKQNSYRTMSYLNEFILPNQQLRNESNTIRAELGIRGTITNKIGFNISAAFGNYKDKLLFVTDTLYALDNNKFRAIFDTTNVGKIEASIFFQLNEKIKLDVIGRYFSYSTKNEIYAWNLPVTQFTFRGSYNLYDKFLVSLNFDLEGGRKAKVFAPTATTIEEDGQYAQNLGFIYDFDLHFEYRYNTRISVFLDLNNMAANRYKRWLNYPVYSFQIMGGCTFRF